MSERKHPILVRANHCILVRANEITIVCPYTKNGSRGHCRRRLRSIIKAYKVVNAYAYVYVGNKKMKKGFLMLNLINFYS